MQAALSRYLLFSEGGQDHCPDGWRFVLESIETGARFAANDREPISSRNRLELLAVVRGLESLDGPAHITLVTSSRYVARGIQRGLQQWRNHGWRWEHFGRIVPVRDYDLWQRIDRALEFHTVSCRCWAFHEESELGFPPERPSRSAGQGWGDSPFSSPPLPCRESEEPALAGA